MSSNLPEPDPAVGSAFAEEAAQARRDIEQSLSDGNSTLDSVFSMVDNERDEGSPHRIAGHMNVKAALIALPNIGEKRAYEILNAVFGEELTQQADGEMTAVWHSMNLDEVGNHQRQRLAEEVAKYTGD